MSGYHSGPPDSQQLPGLPPEVSRQGWFLSPTHVLYPPRAQERAGGWGGEGRDRARSGCELSSHQTIKNRKMPKILYTTQFWTLGVQGTGI